MNKMVFVRLPIVYTDEYLKWDTHPLLRYRAFHSIHLSVTVALESLVGRSASLETSHYKSSRV